MNTVTFAYDLSMLSYPFVQELTVPARAHGTLKVSGDVSRDVSYAITVRLCENASLTVDDFVKTTAHCKATLLVLLEGDGATFTDTSRYHGAGSAVFFIERAVVHTGAGTESSLEARGIVEDAARAVWRGRIRVEGSAVRARACQKHHALLADANAYIDASPVLEIYTNDVACNHSASVERVRREHLFYLQSRGVAPEEARREMVHGFLYG